MYKMPSPNGPYIGRVFLILLSTGSAVSAMDTLGAFADCIKANQIPPLTSETNKLLRTTFEVIQNANLSESVMKCVYQKLGELRNSSDTATWFIGHTFDPMAVKGNIASAVSVYNKDADYSCLRSVAPEQEQCFMYITSLVFQTGTTAANVCSANSLEPDQTPGNPASDQAPNCLPPSLPIDQCMNFTRFTSECRSDEITILKAATALFYGKCYMAREVTTTTTTTSMPDGRPSTAFFSCGDQIFKSNDLAMLFPPSEVTVPQIVNVTAAKEVQKKSMTSFCMKAEAYGSCVKDGLMAPKSSLDSALSTLLAVQNIEHAFIHYCNLQDVVTSNFECTKNNIRSDTRCYGGVLDVIFGLNTEIGMKTIFQQCKTLMESTSCRVKHQLMPCSERYGHEMQNFYNLLLSPTCRSQTTPIDYGEGYKCFHKLAMDVDPLFENVSGVESFTPKLIEAMRTVCSKKSDWMPCLRNVHKTSKNEIDQLIFKMMIPDNIEAVVDFVCSKVDDFEVHALCVLKSVQTVDHKDPNNCALKLVKEISPMFKANDPASLKENVPELCRYVKPFAECGKRLLFDECDASLAEDAQKLGTMLHKSCHNPNPISGSRVNSISAVVVLGMAFLLHFVDI